MNLGAKGSAVHWLRDIADRNRRQEAVGLFSVCSAHPQVLQAAMRQALASESMLCVESTSNQAAKANLALRSFTLTPVAGVQPV